MKKNIEWIPKIVALNVIFILTIAKNVIILEKTFILNVMNVKKDII